jgi:hypothetical protein
MLKDKIKARGFVELVLRDADGNIKTVKKENLITDLGIAFLAARITAEASNPMTRIGVGTGTTAAAAGDSALGTEVVRVVFDSAVAATTTTTDDSITTVTTFGAGVGTGALTEAGMFADASAGDMLSRVVFAVVNKGASDTLTITWTIVIA